MLAWVFIVNLENGALEYFVYEYLCKWLIL